MGQRGYVGGAFGNQTPKAQAVKSKKHGVGRRQERARAKSIHGMTLLCPSMPWIEAVRAGNGSLRFPLRGMLRCRSGRRECEKYYPPYYRDPDPEQHRCEDCRQIHLLAIEIRRRSEGTLAGVSDAAPLDQRDAYDGGDSSSAPRVNEEAAHVHIVKSRLAPETPAALQKEIERYVSAHPAQKRLYQDGNKELSGISVNR